MKVIAYEILVADAPDEMTQKVAAMLAADKGWHPQGGIAVYHEGVPVYVQAMVRFTELRVVTPGRA